MQKKHLKLYLVKPELSNLDPEEKVGKIVTHCFKVSCDPKPSMILINTKEEKMTLTLPEKIEEISLVAVEQQKDQCIQKIFYAKKNHPVWDRWGKDVATLATNVATAAVPKLIK